MAKTQSHECKGTKGHKYPEKNGEEGPFRVGKQTGIVASDNRERKENEPMGAVLISHCGRNPCQLFPQNKILTTRVRAAVFWGLLIK